MNLKMDKPHNEVTQIQKKICSWAMLCAIIIAVGFLVFHEKSIAKGLVLGTLFSIINFILLGKSISLSLTISQSRARAGLVGFASVVIRYAVLAIPMIVAIRSVSFNFIAVVVGIFSVQIVTLVNYIVIRPVLDRK